MFNLQEEFVDQIVRQVRNNVTQNLIIQNAEVTMSRVDELAAMHLDNIAKDMVKQYFMRVLKDEAREEDDINQY